MQKEIDAVKLIDETKTEKDKTILITYSILLFLILSTIISFFIFFNTYWGDSSIYLVYAKNIASGDFLSFNPGEFSSGATSPLWAIILSIGFILGNGVGFSKLISLILVITALLLSYKTSLVISKFKIGSAIGVVFLWYFLAFSGLLLYESGLTVTLISILIILNYYFITKGEKRYIWYIGIIWMVLPLVRPECIIISVLNVFLLVFLNRNDFNMGFKILGIFLLSLIPLTVYFSYSFIKTGVFSTSCYARHYSLSVIADSVPNIDYNAFFEFFSYPVVIMGFFVGIYGMVKDYNKRCSWLLFLFLTIFIGFIIIFMFYSPVNNPLELQRYVVFVIPFLVPFISLGVLKFIKVTSNFKLGSIILVALIILTLVVVPPVSFVTTYNKLGSLGFDDVTERGAVTYLNSIAEPNATILAYEVQGRYYLRNDLKLLSLDGITDGKIVPFLEKKDIKGFLWKYKPRYMIVNKAVYLPMYSDSVIKMAVDEIGNKEGSSIKIEGIIFKNIEVRKEPSNSEFWGYTEIYQLIYD